MAIEFRCPNCHQMLRTPEESAGKQARCPQCGQVASVPAPGVQPSASAAPPPLNPFAEEGSPPAKPAPKGDFNPYTAPKAYETTPAAEFGGQLARRTIDFGEVLRATWQIFTADLGKCAIVGAILFGVNMALQMVGQILQVIIQQAMESQSAAFVAFAGLAMVLSVIVNVVVQTWLKIGVAIFGLKMARNRSGQFNDLFAGWPYFWPYLLFSILVGVASLAGAAIIIGAPAGIGYAVGQEPGAAIGAVGGVVAYIPMVLYVVLTVFLAVYFIIDRQETVMDALRSSAHFMQGNRLSTFVLMIVLGLASLPLICLTCGIGALFYAPFYAILTGMVYLMATGQPHAALPGSVPPPAKPMKPI